MTVIHDETLRFIAEYTAENGFPPSRREIIAVAKRESPATGQRRIEELIKAGLITVQPRVPRGIRITEDGRQHLAGTIGKAETEEL